MITAGSMTARFAAMTLALEALVVVFAALVAIKLSGLSGTTVLGAGAGLVVLCVVAAAVARRPGGLLLGWVVQVALLATGFWVQAMFGLGLVFAAMWGWLLVVGSRIDRDRDGWPADASDSS